MRSAQIIPFPDHVVARKRGNGGPAQIIPFPREHIGELIARADKLIADWHAVRKEARQVTRDVLTLEQ